MSAELFVVLLLLSVFVWPVFIWRRMRKVQAMISPRDRDEIEQEAGMPGMPYVDEMIGKDGLVYGRPMIADPALMSADKRGGEMPGIEQTLIGKR